uniref:Synaptobrevin, longin-like domain protein n=1 Tax=Tanacetum cinerariifolium TaxID=118510 RepID=A0A6L2M7A2_TANCI|nr:synaptobrevin, longin-like domain protein [Tanacetum cinerariifolium]
MVALQYKAEHNKVGYLLKPTGSDDYHNIIDFLRSSHIRYALTANPIVFDSLVKQFWSTATLRAPELGPPAILATIDRTPYIITKDLVRSSLQLANDGGVTDLPILEIYSGMDALGYATEGKLTFFKNKFSPQWRGMVNNIGNAKKFLMYPRFLQTILGIETRVTRQYKVLVFSSKLFANMRLNFAGNPMLLLPVMLLQAQAGKGTKVAAQDVPHPVPALDQSLPHLTTPSRPQSPDLVAPVLEHDHSSTQPEVAADSFPSTEDEPLGGDFHTSPLRSSHTPLAGQPSRGAEDPITLTALPFIGSTLVQKVHSLEAELHDHKKIFNDVVGKLDKKVKSLEVKLKTKKRKMVVSDSDEEDGATLNVDFDVLCALANAAVAVDSDVPPGSTSQIPTAITYAPTDVPATTFTTPADASDIPPIASSVAPGASSVAPGASGVAPGASSVAPGDSNVSPSVSVPPTATSAVPTATSAVLADDPIVPTIVPTDSPKVHAGASNKGKSLMIEEDIPIPAKTFRKMEKDRLGEEAARRLHEEEMLKWKEKEQRHKERDNRARMAALIKKKRQALAEQLFKERQNRPLTLAQQKAYMRQPGSVLEEPPTKKPKSPEAPTSSMPEIPISPVVISPPFSSTRRKSLGRKHMYKPKSTLPTLDLDAPAQTFLKVIVVKDSGDDYSVDEVWSAVVGWEILSTPLGDINALYRIDGSTKHFATLHQILYMVDRQDLMKLYGLVVQYYEHHTATGAGLLFWGDLQVLFDSQAGGKGSFVWQNQHLWEIQSWQLYTLLNIHVLETVSELASPEQTATGKDISNPFMAVMVCQKSLGYSNSPLIHVLRIGLVINPPGYVVPTGRVIVPAGRYIVPTGSIIWRRGGVGGVVCRSGGDEVGMVGVRWWICGGYGVGGGGFGVAAEISPEMGGRRRKSFKVCV